MNYINRYTPNDYFCKRCNVSGVKLWREGGSFTVNLLCAMCACITQNKNTNIDSDGKHSNEHGITSDQIGWYLPAVPTEYGKSYWGYTSVPDSACVWWRRLPTYK